MTWELGPLVEKTERFEHRVARENGAGASHFSGDRRLMTAVAAMRGVGHPYLPVLDAGDGWVVTELDLSLGLNDVAVILEQTDLGPLEPIPPPVVAAVGRLMLMGGAQSGLRFDWRGGLRLRPGFLEAIDRADLLARMAPGAVSAVPWDETRVAVFLMRWLEENHPGLFADHQAAEAWIETLAPPAIEQPVLANPDDEGAWRVLADALLEQGHPRGALMALQLSGAEASATRNHLRKHPWLLPLGGRSLALYLERGFVMQLEATDGADVPPMLKHPALRFLRELTLSMAATEIPAVVRALEEGGRHSGVRKVALAGVSKPGRHEARLARAFPNLVDVVSRP